MDKRQSINVTTPFLIMNDSGGGRGLNVDKWTGKRRDNTVTIVVTSQSQTVAPSLPSPSEYRIRWQRTWGSIYYNHTTITQWIATCRSSFCIKLSGLTMAGTRRDLINAPRFAVNVTSSFVTCTREALMAIDFTVVARDRRWTLVKTNCCSQFV